MGRLFLDKCHLFNSLNMDNYPKRNFSQRKLLFHCNLMMFFGNLPATVDITSVRIQLIS